MLAALPSHRLLPATLLLAQSIANSHPILTGPLALQPVVLVPRSAQNLLLLLLLLAGSVAPVITKSLPATPLAVLLIASCLVGLLFLRAPKLVVVVPSTKPSLLWLLLLMEEADVPKASSTILATTMLATLTVSFLAGPDTASAPRPVVLVLKLTPVRSSPISY